MLAIDLWIWITAILGIIFTIIAFRGTVILEICISFFKWARRMRDKLPTK